LDEEGMNPMNKTNPLVTAVQNKVLEEIERTQNLLGLIPADQLDWRPTVDSFCVGELLGHLLECLAGFCAVFYGLREAELAHFKSLRELTVNHRCEISEAGDRLSMYQSAIEEGFALLRDEELAYRLPTIFVQEGETVLTLLLGNLEHLINHKYQLFFYLKLLAVEVTSADLYHFRSQ
jgi:hypothetical protein